MPRVLTTDGPSRNGLHSGAHSPTTCALQANSVLLNNLQQQAMESLPGPPLSLSFELPTLGDASGMGRPPPPVSGHLRPITTGAGVPTSEAPLSALPFLGSGAVQLKQDPSFSADHTGQTPKLDISEGEDDEDGDGDDEYRPRKVLRNDDGAGRSSKRGRGKVGPGGGGGSSTQGGRFSGRLPHKEDEAALVTECELLAPLVGGMGDRGERSRCTLARIVRGIACGAVRKHLSAREALVSTLQQQVAQLQQQSSKPVPLPPPAVSAPGLAPPPQAGAPSAAELQQWQFLAREQHKRMQTLRQQLGESQARAAHLEAQLQRMQSYVQQQQQAAPQALPLRSSLPNPFTTAAAPSVAQQVGGKKEAGAAAGGVGSMRGTTTLSHNETTDVASAAASAHAPPPPTLGAGPDLTCPNPFADFSASLGRGSLAPPSVVAPLAAAATGPPGRGVPPLAASELQPLPLISSGSPAVTSLENTCVALPLASTPGLGTGGELECPPHDSTSRFLMGLNRVSSPISRWIDEWGDSMSGPVTSGVSPMPPPPPAPLAVMKQVAATRTPPAFWEEAMLAAHGSGKAMPVGPPADGSVPQAGAAGDGGADAAAGGGVAGDDQLAGASGSGRMQPWWVAAAMQAQASLNTGIPVPKEES